jgi:hypothetical protein
MTDAEVQQAKSESGNRAAFVHGMTGTPEHQAWSSIKRRCYDPTVENYPDYGGRGIKMCDEWLASFTVFYAHVGPRPSPKHSIDRYPDNDGNYEPGNVRWATAKQQARHRRSNVLLSYAGKTQCIAAWAEEKGLSVDVLWHRLNELNWSLEQALTRPLDTRKSRDRKGPRQTITFNGESRPVEEWSKITGLPVSTIKGRINRSKWTVDRALTEPARPHVRKQKQTAA